MKDNIAVDPQDPSSPYQLVNSRLVEALETHRETLNLLKQRLSPIMRDPEDKQPLVESPAYHDPDAGTLVRETHLHGNIVVEATEELREILDRLEV